MIVYLAAAGAFVVYMVLAWSAGYLLRLQGADLWILRGILTLLGITALAIFLWFWTKMKRASAGAASADGAAGAGDEIDQLFREAEARLAASRAVGGAGVRALPVVLLTGEPASAKTSILVQSGLEPELLAGLVYQENNVAPTRTANLWFARQSVFVEAAGRLLAEPARWIRLARRLMPGRMASVLAREGQAPRAVVLCVDCEKLVRPGAAEAMAASARGFQTRLGEISQSLGINLPVYVLFTKADRIAFFNEYVRNLSHAEATQVFGVTLPMRPAASTGVYAEEQTRYLAWEFQRLFHTLCDRRLDYLPRENEGEKLPQAYEFPREFRKLAPIVVQFLVEIGRPSQLRTGPFLRGFYFSGVRPVVVTETASAPSAARPAQSYQAASGATSIFQVGLPAGQPAQAAASAYTSSRRVPQWLFLSHLFNDVILADRAAMGASGTSVKASLLRRILLGTAAGLFLLASIGFLVSFLCNRSLEGDALAAARAAGPLDVALGQAPSLDALQRLENLRQSLDQLTTYQQEGPPLRLRWGLYTGDDLYPVIRRIYYQRFHQLLFAQTQAAMLDWLQRLPAAPGATDDYGVTYDTLKAYLITTANHDKTSKAFLSPVLMNRWPASRGLDAERTQLTQKQFDFYSVDLKTANPYSSEPDAAAVDRARRFLAQFTGIERVYRFMLAEASRTNPAVNFNQKFPGSAEVLINNRDVAGAFSRGGWGFMQNAIKHADRYFSGERWVLGDYSAANIDRSRLEQDLRDRYFADFIAQWRAFLRNSALVRYGSLRDAAKKLNTLSGNQSPLLALFWLASQNTAVDSPKITEAFQPVQFVVPPANLDRYVGPANTAYLNALVTLQSSLDQASAQATPDPGAVSQTVGNASNAHIAAKQVAQNFRLDSEAHIETVVQKLMEDPITNAEALLRGVGPGELNAKARALCGQFRELWSKYPFNSSALNRQATLQEVGAIFRPREGALWAFYDANLKPLLSKQGAQYVAAPNGPMQLTPQFVGFFNRAAVFSEALYPGGAAEPRLSYSLTPLRTDGIQALTLIIDGQTFKSSGQGGAAKQFTWPGASAHEAKLTGKFGGPDLALLSYEGVWAAFQFFGEAERWQSSGTGYNLEWVIRIGGKPVLLPGGAPLTVRYYLDMNGAPPFFQKGYFSGLGCVAEAARH
jgi:type VI secretion system protein ImpL